MTSPTHVTIPLAAPHPVLADESWLRAALAEVADWRCSLDRSRATDEDTDPVWLFEATFGESCVHLWRVATAGSDRVAIIARHRLSADADALVLMADAFVPAWPYARDGDAFDRGSGVELMLAARSGHLLATCVLDDGSPVALHDTQVSERTEGLLALALRAACSLGPPSWFDADRAALSLLWLPTPVFDALAARHGPDPDPYRTWPPVFTDQVSNMVSHDFLLSALLSAIDAASPLGEQLTDDVARELFFAGGISPQAAEARREGIDALRATGDFLAGRLFETYMTLGGVGVLVALASRSERLGGLIGVLPDALVAFAVERHLFRDLKARHRDTLNPEFADRLDALVERRLARVADRRRQGGR